MNGNANLNANNLTPQNVVDWRKKLGIGSFVNKYERVIYNISSTSWQTIDISSYIENYDPNKEYEILITNTAYTNATGTTTAIYCYSDLIANETNPLTLARGFSNGLADSGPFYITCKRYLYFRKSAYKSGDGWTVTFHAYR